MQTDLSSNQYHILIKTLFGLEHVLAEELNSLGIQNVGILNRAVEFKGDLTDIYKSNLYLRTAMSVYLKIGEGNAANQDKLYNTVRNIRWDKYFSVNNTFAIEAFSNSKTLTHSQFTAQKTKDAIADFFRDFSGKRPNVDLEKPDIKIYVHVNNDKCTLYLNSSGVPLYYRGYNKRTGLAPLNDILAAGIIKLTGWNEKTPLYDPMCGCGTIPAEAYMIANNIPPTIFRQYFAFKHWLNFDNDLWQSILFEARSKIKKNTDIRIHCSDIDYKIIKDASINLSRIDSEHNIDISRKDFFNASPPFEEGIIISNPPYGLRLTSEDINNLYKKIGDKLKFNYNNYDAWLISSELKAMKFIGLKPSKKIILYNGQLECRLNKYSIYKGSIKSGQTN